MTRQRFTLPIACKTKQRPNFSSRAKGSKGYHKDWYTDWKTLVWALLKQAGAKLMDGNLRLRVDLSFKKSARGDIDNYVGALMDAGEGVLFANDKQVKSVLAVIHEHTSEDSITLVIDKLS